MKAKLYVVNFDTETTTTPIPVVTYSKALAIYEATRNNTDFQNITNVKCRVVDKNSRVYNYLYNSALKGWNV